MESTLQTSAMPREKTDDALLLQMIHLLRGRTSSPNADVRPGVENEVNQDQPQNAAPVSLDEDIPMTFPQRVS